MNKREFERLARQEETLRALGFTQDECARLRRISMTLQRWHELECGVDGGCIERDEDTGIPRWFNSNARYVDPYDPRAYRVIPDREKGAKKRLTAIIKTRNERVNAEKTICPNCGQWQRAENYGDCLHECVKRGFAPSRKVDSFIQTDPRGAALYILRPGDIPAGQSADAYYTRGICVY